MTSQPLIKALQHLLADTYALYLKTQNYHWHVKSHNFLSLHELFDKQYKQLAEAVDEIAERIVILGGQAPATFKSLQGLTSIVDGDSTLAAQNMITDLASDQNKLIKSLKNVLSIAQNDCEEGTASFISEHIAGYEKNRWMLESHLR